MSTNPTAPTPATAEVTGARKWDAGKGAVTTVIQDSNGAKHAITIHVVLGEKQCPQCGRIIATLPAGGVDIEAEISSAIAAIETRSAAIRAAFAKSPKYAPPSASS